MVLRRWSKVYIMNLVELDFLGYNTIREGLHLDWYNMMIIGILYIIVIHIYKVWQSNFRNQIHFKAKTPKNLLQNESSGIIFIHIIYTYLIVGALLPDFGHRNHPLLIFQKIWSRSDWSDSGDSPNVPQSSLGFLRVPQFPPPLEHPPLGNPTSKWGFTDILRLGRWLPPNLSAPKTQGGLNFKGLVSHDGSMGPVYSPTWMVDFYGKCS